MLHKEVKDRVADFFDPWDLIEFLQISVEDVIEAFEDEIEEALDDVEELMGVSNDRRGILGSSGGEED